MERRSVVREFQVWCYGVAYEPLPHIAFLCNVLELSDRVSRGDQEPRSIDAHHERRYCVLRVCTIAFVSVTKFDSDCKSFDISFDCWLYVHFAPQRRVAIDVFTKNCPVVRSDQSCFFALGGECLVAIAEANNSKQTVGFRVT